jgi:hypothetical protein
MKRLQVHSTQELRATPHMKTTQTVVSGSAAFPASGCARSSPSFGGVVPLSSNGGSGSSRFSLRSSSTAPLGSEAFAAFLPSLPQSAAVAATSSGNTQFSPAFCAFTATTTQFVAPALSSFGFGNTSVPSFGSSSAATPFSGFSFPSASSAASFNSSSPHLGTGIGSAVFGSSAGISFPAQTPFAFGTSTHATLPGVQQPLLALSSTPSLQHQPVAQASKHQAAAQDQAPKLAPISGQRMNHVDAVKLLEHVRVTFIEMPSKYNSFVNLMEEFKLQKIKPQQVIDRVKLLFQGHPDLIDGFNMFMPPRFHISVDRSETSRPVETPMTKQYSTSYEPCTSQFLAFAIIALIMSCLFSHSISLQLCFCNQSQATLCSSQSTLHLQRICAGASQVPNRTPLRRHRKCPDQSPVRRPPRSHR